MHSVLSIWREMGRVWFDAISSPFFVALYVAIFFAISWSYGRKQPQADKSVLLKSAGFSALIGLAAGLLGSSLLVVAGIDVRRLNILALWLIALGLALFNTRFICFAYAGGLLALFSLMASNSDYCVPHLTGLIAILHLIESGLILADGSTQAQLVSFKKAGQPVQVFRLQRFWPLLLVVSCSSSDYGLGHTMPSWWPLLKCHPPRPEDSLYIMLPVLAILGYGEIASQTAPRRTVVRSARNLAVYSLILLILSLMASYYPVISWLAAVFAPLGHEIVIWMGPRDVLRT